MASIEVTEAAASKALALLAKSDSPADALRLRVIDGGCSGMRYELAFDGARGNDDESFDAHGLQVVIDSQSATFLDGTTIDYQDSLNDAGFRIENPLASATCGCGESFSV